MDVSPSISIYRWVASGVALVVIKFVVEKVLSVRKAFASIKDSPGRAVLWIKPLGALSLALGPTFPTAGMFGYCGGKFSLYKKLGTTSFASVFLPGAQPFFWLADAEAIKIVSSDQRAFQKDVVSYDIINVYGGNVVSREGAEWRRHRSVARSAFNEANVALAWSESLRVTDEWFEQLDAAGCDTTVDLLPTMTEATLLVISAANFGKRIAWTAGSTEELPPGCQLTYQSAVTKSVGGVVPRALIPEWFYSFSSLIKVPYLSSRALMTRLAFDDLRRHMLNLVASARADITSGKHAETFGSALLWNIVEANMKQEGESKRLTEDEVLSNIFVFLLAGHETSAHALCFAFALLALNPDSQEKVYEEVTRIWPEDVPVTQLMAASFPFLLSSINHQPTFAQSHSEYMEKLEYTMGCIREALRMFPVVPWLSRDVHADTVLPGTSFTLGSDDSLVETGNFSMAVPAGSSVVLDVWAVHMNPLYWGEDAEEFKPERFIDTESYQWPRHAFLPFWVGARSCIGQRFAYTEMTAIVASVVRRYRVQVPDDLAKKPLEVQKASLLKFTTGVALTPLGARVKLCLRV